MQTFKVLTKTANSDLVDPRLNSHGIYKVSSDVTMAKNQLILYVMIVII